MKANCFIVRTYGIYLDPARGLLVSDELIQGRMITKLPGGGLEYGEGTIDCLKREMMEETGNEFEVLNHFYTTDFFVESAFHPERQVISIYYTMKPASVFNCRIADKPFDFQEPVEGAQSLRFVAWEEISPEVFTFSIDKRVAEMIARRGVSF